jgi:hypothetical protein
MLLLAQEQMRRILLDNLAAMPRRFMSNPALLKFASKSMKYYHRGLGLKRTRNSEKLEAAAADPGKSSEISREDETIVDALKEAEEKLGSLSHLESDINFRPSSSKPFVAEPDEKC